MQAVKDELARIKRDSFVKDYKASDPECMGLLVAHFFKWDGLAILWAAHYALEDANFHAFASKLEEMANAVEAS